ncbi:MAG: hypothetical protein J7K68_06165 [Candidatus Diapherotrites archaeon]|nr:hypothetical protein [Candidatus Diapherotrites archaeon]
MFKQVELVITTPSSFDPRIKRFFEKNGFKRSLGGKMAIRKDEWREINARV